MNWTCPCERVRVGGGGARSRALARDSGRRLRPRRRDGRRRRGRGVRRGGAGRRRRRHVAVGRRGLRRHRADRRSVTAPDAAAAAVLDRRYAELPSHLSGAAVLMCPARRFTVAERTLPHVGRIFTPRPEHKFSFGLWTVGNRGRDPFGEPRAAPLLVRSTPSAMLGEVGAWGVNLHDNDLVPIDATPSERDRIVARLQEGLRQPRHRGADGDRDAVLPIRCSATARSRPTIRPSARTPCRRRCAPWTWARNSARRSSCCGAAAKAPRPTRAGGPTTPSSGCARRIDFLCEYSIDKKYGYRFALEAKPNEPRGDIYMATTGNYLGLIPTLAHPEHGGREPGGRSRDDGGPELPARGRRRRGRPASCSTSTSTTRSSAATTRTSGSARRIPKPRSSW